MPLIEMAGDLVSQMLQANTALLAAMLMIFIFMAYKLFKLVIKAAIIGAMAASFPVVASLSGLPVAITLDNIIWFGLLGVLAFFAYSSISTLYKVGSFISRPLTGGKGNVKERVIIREVPEKKE